MNKIIAENLDNAPINSEFTEETSKPYSILPLSLRVFAPIFFIISYIIVYVAFNNNCSFINTFIHLGLILSIAACAVKNGYALTKKSKQIIAILCFFALSFSYTDNSFICILVSIFEFLGSAYLIAVICHPFEGEDFSHPYYLMNSAVKPFTSNTDIFYPVVGTLATTKCAAAFIGLLIAIPTTLITGALLTSADERFNMLITSIFAFPNSTDGFIVNIIEIVPAMLIASSIFSALYTHITEDKFVYTFNDNIAEKISAGRKVDPMVLITATLPPLLLYVMFFFVQAEYIFGAFLNQLPEGFIYSDYARQGFFELFILALINLAGIVILQLKVRLKSNRNLIIDIISIVLSVLTLLLIATAIRKMLLYIQYYSLTRLRIYTMFFMILLAAVFVLIIIWLIRKKSSFKLFKKIGITFVLWFMLLVFSRPDNIIARVNVHMYEIGSVKNLDVDELYKLSCDAWTYLADLDCIPNIDKNYYYQNKLTNTQNISSIIVYNKLK